MNKLVSISQTAANASFPKQVLNALSFETENCPELYVDAQKLAERLNKDWRRVSWTLAVLYREQTIDRRTNRNGHFYYRIKT